MRTLLIFEIKNRIILNPSEFADALSLKIGLTFSEFGFEKQKKTRKMWFFEDQIRLTWVM